MALTGEEFGASLLEAAMRAKVGGGKSPLPQLALQHIYDVLRPLLQNTYRGYVAPSQPTTETIQTQDYGACDLPDIQAHQVVVAYDTPAMTDNLGQVIEGGPHAGDDISYQDISGQSSTIALGTMGSMGRRLPYISDVLKGDGTTQDYYGTQTYTSPDTGQAVAGVGHQDSRVRKPTLRMLLGEGLMFSATPPNLTDPALGGTPPSHNPRPGDPPDKYATLDLLTIGGVLSAGLTKTGGDDGNGIGILLDAHPGLQIKANKLSVLPDGTSTWIDQTTGQLKAGAGGQPPVVYDPGPGIEFTQAPDSATPSAALSVQAQAGAGLLPGSYSYAFAWQTDLGSTKPSPLATGTADSTNGQMVLTLPPVPANLTALGIGSITGAIFLRSKAGSTDLYTLATEGIVSGTTPSPYIDIAHDSGLTTIYQPDHVIASHLAFSDANRTIRASGLSRTAGQDKKGEAINLASVGGHLAAGLIITGGDDQNGLRLYEAMIAGARAGTLDWAVGDDGNGAAVRRDDITIGKNSADQLIAKAITSPSGSTDPVGTSTNPWGCGPNAWTPSSTTGEGPVPTTTSSSTTGGLPSSPTTPPAAGSYAPSDPTMSPMGPGYNCAGNPPATTKYSSLTFAQTDVAKYSVKAGSGFTLKSQTADPATGTLHLPTGAGGHNGSGFWLQYQVTVLNNVVDPNTGFTGIAAQDMNYGTGPSGQLVWTPVDHQWHVLSGFLPGGGIVPSVQPGLTAYVAWYGDCTGRLHLLMGSDASHFTEVYHADNFAPSTGVTFEFGAAGCFSSGFPRTSSSPVQPEFQVSGIYCADGVPPGTVIANFNDSGNTFSGTPGTMDGNGAPITPLLEGMPAAPIEILPPILTAGFPAGETFGVTIDSATDPSYDPATVADLQAQASAACSGCSATGAPFYTCSGIVSAGDIYAPSLTGDHIHALKDFLDDGNMLVKGKAEIDGTVLLKSDVEMQGKFYDATGNLYGVTSLDDSAGHKAVGDVQIILDSTSGLTGVVDPAANTYTIKGTAPGTGGGTGGATGGSGTGSVGSGGTTGGVGAGSGGTAQTTCTVTYDASQVVQCGSPPLPVDSYGALCTYNASTCSFLDSHGAVHDPSAPFPGGSVPSGTVPVAQCPQVTPVYAQGTGKTYYQWQGTTGAVATGGSTASGPSTVVNSLNGLVGDLGLYAQNGLTIALSGTSIVVGNARPGYIGGPFHVSTDSTHGTGRLDVDGPAWFAQDVVANGGHLVLHPPSAPLVAPTVNTAPGTELGVGTYLYGFTETIGGVEGSLSPVAALITTATNQRGVVSLQASGSTITSRTIYRTPVNQTGPMGLVGTIAGNGATSWTDQVIDASLGVAPPGPATITMLDDAGLAGGTDSAPIRHLHIAVDGDDLWLPAFRHGFAGLAGLVIDPTTSRGDMIARGLSGLVRLPVGAAGTVLLGGTDPSYGQVTDATVAAAAGIALSKLGQSGASTNMVIGWNGTAWAPLSTSGVVGSGLVAATTTQLGGVLVDRNPASGSPVALTQYGLLRPPTAITASPLLPFGDAPFDGVTAGYFVGRGGGTMLGMNFLPPAATYAGTVLALSNLVAYWRLAETSGAVATDYSGNGHTASYGSGVTLGLPGATADNDLSASYPSDLGGPPDGLFDYAAPATGIPIGSAARSFIWHWKGTYQGLRRSWLAYGTWTAGLTAFFFEQGDTSTNVRLSTGANTDAAYSWTVPAIYDGAFHQFILSYDPGTSLVTLYIDGISRGTQNVGTLATGATDFSVGWPYYHPVCIGNYDEIVVRSSITTASEASSLYSAALQSGAFGVLDVQQRGISRWSFDSTGNQVMAGTLSIARQIISTLPTGVAPLSVQSQTGVTNLNADMVDGQHAAAFALAGGAPTAHEATHLPGGSDPLPWTTIHGSGVLASRPAAAATNAGYTYYATDAAIVYESTGTAWVVRGAAGTGAALPTATADYVGTFYFRTSDNTLWYCTGTPTWVQASGGAGGSGSSTLAGDTDVLISSPSDGQALLYQTSDGKWHNKSLTGASVNKIQLSYVLATDQTAVALTANTWTTIGAQQTFSVDDGQSITDLALAVGCLITSASTIRVAARVLIDGAVAIHAGEQFIQVVNAGINPFTTGFLPLGQLSGGNHTISVQVYADGAAGSLYCRPVTLPDDEFMSATVIERKVAPTGASGMLDMLRAYLTAAQTTSATASAWKSIIWDAERYNTSGSAFHSTSTNPSRVTVQTPGRYRIAASVRVTGATSDVGLQIIINGSGAVPIAYEEWNGVIGASSSLDIDTDYDFVAGDYFEVQVACANASISLATGLGSTRLSVRRIDGYAINAKTGQGDMEYGGAGGIPTRLAPPSGLTRPGVVYDTTSNLPVWEQRVWTSFASAGNTTTPDPVVDTQIPDMTLTFTLARTSLMVITSMLKSSRSGGSDRINIHIDGTVAYGATGIASYMYPAPEGTAQQGQVFTQISLAAGSHTIGVFWNAALNTNAVTWYDRLLKAEIVG